MSAKYRPLALHVAELCVSYGIHIDVKKSTRAIAWTDSQGYRGIRVTPIKSIKTYIIALHELGHHLGEWQQGPTLEKEAGAWKWAIDNSLVALPPACWAMIGKNIGSYLRWAILQSGRKSIPLPHPDHYFWKLIALYPANQEYYETLTDHQEYWWSAPVLRQRLHPMVQAH